jgi:hypothetical protein
MTRKSIFPIDHVYGLAFDIELDPSRPSGFKPAEIHLGSESPLPMYGELRLHGFAAAIAGNFCKHLAIIGKDEKRIKDRTVYQGYAICEMLARDLGVDRNRISWNMSGSNTGHTLSIIRDMVRDKRRTGKHRRYAIITSHYHKDRSGEGALLDGWNPTFLSAESFILATCISDEERAQKKAWIETELRKYDYVAREIAEINGIADMRRGTYQPKTKGW